MHLRIFSQSSKTHALGNIFQIQLEVQLPTQITEALHRFYLLEVDCKFHIMKNDKRVRQENGKVFTSPLLCCQIITIIRRMITNMRTPVTAIQTTSLH